MLNLKPMLTLMKVDRLAIYFSTALPVNGHEAKMRARLAIGELT